MSEMHEVIIERLLQILEAQQKGMKALNETLRMLLEDPDLDREKLLSLSMINSRAMVEDAEEIITTIRQLWGEP